MVCGYENSDNGNNCLVCDVFVRVQNGLSVQFINSDCGKECFSALRMNKYRVYHKT